MPQSRWAKLATYNTGFEVDLLCVALDAAAIPYLVRRSNRGEYRALRALDVPAGSLHLLH